MGIPKPLKIGNRIVNTTDVTYEDLKILYQQYIDTYGAVPIFSKCDAKHNMPQGRIINRVLENEGITYNEFVNMFGKYGRVRTESKNYDLFVEKYKQKANELGRYIAIQELVNNEFGLPGASWFVKYCPDENVKSYSDFVKWCEFDIHYSLTKDYVSEKLIELENELHRPIVRSDITEEKVGFSSIVINRLYGGLNNAKNEIGLLKTLPFQPKDFEYYRDHFEKTLNLIYKNTGRNFASWNDIESTPYNGKTISHKTYTSAFKREGLDVFVYAKELGYKMCTNKTGHTFLFDDGELTKSTYEYDFSTYLRNNKIPYTRNVKYKEFSDEKSNIDCGYRIKINEKYLYVEIAGLIYNGANDDWRTREYSTKRCQSYLKKMLMKESILINTNSNYLFLFPWDMNGGSYIDMIQEKINELSREVV